MKPTTKPHATSFRASSSSAAGASLPFGEPQHPSDVYTAHVDGAARGNPGPASYAAIVRAPNGAIAWQMGKYIGRTTNNVAEYYGLIAALDYAAAQGIARLRVISDSELMVKQMQGRYKVKSADLRPLHERAQKLARGLAFFAIEHVRREGNSDADALANAALDRTSSSSATPSNAFSSNASSSSASSSSVSPSASSHSSQGNSSPRSSSPRIAMTPHMRATSGEDEAPRARSERKVRARYSNGALHPLEPIELAEGETVEIHIRRK